jgi:hypothetical protein
MLRWTSAAALLVCGVGIAAAAHAADGPRCGLYRAAEYEGAETRLVLRSPTVARVEDGADRYDALVRREGGVLRLYRLRDGVTFDYALDGDTLISAEGFGADLRLADPAPCEHSAPPVPGSCAADPEACFAVDDSDGLRRHCDAGVPFACDRLIERWTREAALTPEQRARPKPAPPPECREGEASYDEAACLRTVSALLATEMRDVFAERDALPLPAAQLDYAAAACDRTGTANVCQRAAEALWNAARFADAVPLLRRACDAGGDDALCGHARALAALPPADLRPQTPQTLPCGDYASGDGLYGTLAFGDRGRVSLGIGQTLRARLEDGRVRIRHDKGGDFVLQPIGGGRYLGIDRWTQYAVYTRQGGASECAAPVTWREVPLKADCDPTAGTLEACCAKGSLQGCNGLGHQHALAGRWADAAPHYETVCRAGVREGCENLVQVFARTGDAQIRARMEALCATDPRHVACDVADTADWESVALGAELEALAERLLREEPAEPDADGEESPEIE